MNFNRNTPRQRPTSKAKTVRLKWKQIGSDQWEKKFVPRSRWSSLMSVLAMTVSEVFERSTCEQWQTYFTL